jgi:hypothetical protein
MKKLMIAALMLLGTSAAFAGDSDPLKAILKAATYAEAESLLKSNLSQLTDNAEKAKAYNKLVDLAMKKVDAEQTAQLENETNKKMGKEASKTVDEVGMYTALDQAFTAAAECNKYDLLPNAKGKVKPRFADANADRLYALRGQLINGGIYYQNAKDDANAYKYLANYVETAESPMFSKFDIAKDQNLTNIAYFAAIYAFQNKEYAKAEKYVKYAMKDPERAKEAQNIQFAVMGAQAKNHADSLVYAQKLQDMYAADKANDDILNQLVLVQEALGNTANASQLINDRLAADPSNFVALTLLGDLQMRAKKWDESAATLEKALAKAPEDRKIAINSAIGTCYLQKIQERVNAINGAISPAAKEQFNVVYKKAITFLEAAKAQDKTYEFKNQWAYALYNCYYNVFGANDPKTKEAAMDAGVNQ